MDLTRSARSLATLVVLAVLVLAGALWGFHAMTRPFPAKLVAAACVDTRVDKGASVRPSQVTVSVLNAGSRSGLAMRTMSLFTDAGFARGDLDNAPVDTQVANVAIWTSDPGSPAVRLVRSRLHGKVQVKKMATDEVGVVVVVGDRFSDLVKGRAAVTAKADTTICSPESD